MEKNRMNRFSLIAIILLTSIGIGTICTTVITCIAGGFDVTVMRYIIWACASMLYGLASYLIFAKDKLNLPVGIGLHCIICLIITFAACKFCRFQVEKSIWVEILIIFVIVYAIIFFCCYFTAKAEAKRINDNINRNK